MTWIFAGWMIAKLFVLGIDPTSSKFSIDGTGGQPPQVMDGTGGQPPQALDGTGGQPPKVMDGTGGQPPARL